MKLLEILFCKIVALMFRVLFQLFPLDVVEGLRDAVEFEFSKLSLELEPRGIDPFTSERGKRLEEFRIIVNTCRNQIAMGLAGIDDERRLPPMIKHGWRPVAQVVFSCCGDIATFTDLVFVGILDGLNSMIAQCGTLKRNLDVRLDCESNHAKRNVESLRQAFIVLSRLYPKVSRELGAGIPNVDRLRRLQCVRVRFMGGQEVVRGRGRRVVGRRGYVQQS